ncbi:flagellar hook-length control protein FliK [Azotosporobacter soli]|uniref:flagellar hook-length control protein FliK n=1 Tax=Azotosporobacter soli TaxID=3055040 RepID=UPI0031FF301A
MAEVQMVIAMQLKTIPAKGAVTSKKETDASTNPVFGKMMQEMQGKEDVPETEKTQAQDVNVLSMLMAAVAMPTLNEVKAPAAAGTVETPSAVGAVANGVPAETVVVLQEGAKNPLPEQAQAQLTQGQMLSETALEANAATPSKTAQQPLQPSDGKVQVPVQVVDQKQGEKTLAQQNDVKQIAGKQLEKAEVLEQQQGNAGDLQKEPVNMAVEQTPVPKQTAETSNLVQATVTALQGKITVEEKPMLSKEAAEQSLKKEANLSTTQQPVMKEQQTNGQSGEHAQEQSAKMQETLKTAEATPKPTETANSFFSVLDAQAKPFQTVLPSAQPHVVMQQPVSTQDPYQVVTQIVDQAKLVTMKDSTQMVIRLNPEHLGEMTLRISVDNGNVSAAFHTDNQEVRHLLESSMPQLKQDLANQGFKVDSVDIYAGLGNSLPDKQQGQDGQQQNKSQQQQNHQTEQNFFDSVDELSRALEESADGVDYRV